MRKQHHVTALNPSLKLFYTYCYLRKFLPFLNLSLWYLNKLVALMQSHLQQHDDLDYMAHSWLLNTCGATRPEYRIRLSVNHWLCNGHRYTQCELRFLLSFLNLLILPHFISMPLRTKNVRTLSVKFEQCLLFLVTEYFWGFRCRIQICLCIKPLFRNVEYISFFLFCPID